MDNVQDNTGITHIYVRVQYKGTVRTE